MVSHPHDTVHSRSPTDRWSNIFRACPLPIWHQGIDVTAVYEFLQVLPDLADPSEGVYSASASMEERLSYTHRTLARHLHGSTNDTITQAYMGRAGAAARRVEEALPDLK